MLYILKEVAIDLLEVTFKDEYISRSDMLRLVKYMMNRCVYKDEYIQFSDITIKVTLVFTLT